MSAPAVRRSQAAAAAGATAVAAVTDVSMASGPVGPPLLSLFRELLARGARLSVRDYLDALRALEAGYGGECTQGRTALRRLAEALWARSDEERRVVARWFESLGPVPEPLLRPLDERVRSLSREVAAASLPAAGRAQSVSSQPGVGAGLVPSAASDGESARTTGDGAGASGPSARVAFGAGHGGGLPLPRVLATPPIDDEYVLHPQPLISLRELVVLWRRYRRAVRTGARTEMDLDATVRERCRRGVLERPVLRARRRNTARLLVLVDASPSMAPWQAFCETLAASLAPARLGDAALRWFTNIPRAEVHASPALDAPEPRADLLHRFTGAGLLIVSDGGSARGVLNRRRAAQTARFLEDAAAACSRIVWLNPMPRARWARSTAALLADDPRLTMLPLDAEHLLRAVDILRGHK